MQKDSNEVMLIYMKLYEFRLNSYMAQDSNLSLCIIIMVYYYIYYILGGDSLVV